VVKRAVLRCLADTIGDIEGGKAYP